METWKDSVYKNVNYSFSFVPSFKISVSRIFRFEIGDALGTSFRGTCKQNINFTGYNEQKSGDNCTYSV